MQLNAFYEFGIRIRQTVNFILTFLNPGEGDPGKPLGGLQNRSGLGDEKKSPQ